MKKRKKDILAMPDKNISIKELAAVRKQEMSGCLPGLTTKVSVGKDEAWVDSPKIFDRNLFKVGDFN